MVNSSTQSPYFLCYLSAQVKLKDKGFLSRDNTVKDLLLNEKDYHHIFPKKYLKEKGMSRAQYNQIANLVVSRSDIKNTLRS